VLGAKENIISQLRKDILQLGGFKAASADIKEVISLPAIESAFPNSVFPTGAIHEFLNAKKEDAAASSGFISGLLGPLMRHGGACLWISAARKIFPPALKAFGVAPDKIIFIDVQREREVLWATEEALKCEGLAAVIAEVRELTFMQSRRLQLAVEVSKVTGFVLRSDLRRLSATACVARWQITSVPGELAAGMPGVGFPRWQVDLLKVRNGKPGSWHVEWIAGKFALVAEKAIAIKLKEQVRKVG
jgi:protein ImuA